MEIWVVVAAVIVAGICAFALGEWLVRRSAEDWTKRARDRMRGK